MKNLKRTGVGSRGLTYSSDLMRGLGVAVGVLLAAHFSIAMPSDALPEPAPTDAVRESGQTIRVEGRAALDQGTVEARYAALLDAYDELLKVSLKRGLFEGSWAEARDGRRFFRVDAEHPNKELISWLSRAKVQGESELEKEKILTLESAPTGSVASLEPTLRAMRTQDVDGDGLTDVAGIGYDGAVYVIKGSGKGVGKVAARSESFASVELLDSPGYERVITVLPQDVLSVEPAGSGAVRFLVSFEKLEMANGRLLGRATEQREILIPLSEGTERIRFSLSEPPDFAYLMSPEVEIRGTAISDQLLAAVDIRHNGILAWESPASLGIRALQFNLARELEPGWNCFRISARDKDGYTRVRELWLEGPPVSKVRGSVKKRAILVSLDKKFAGEKLSKLLAQGGFSSESVTVLEGSEATALRLTAELKKGMGAESLFLYCESGAVGGDPLEGKSLLFADGKLTPSQLAEAIGAGGYRKSVGLFYTEIAREQRGGLDSQTLWRDTSTFLERLGGAGRLVFAPMESMEQGTKTQRKRSRERLMKSLEMIEGSDLERVVVPNNSKDLLFRGWMFGKPVIGRS